LRRFQRLAVATTAATAALIVIGAVVRATGSGLGCPDWPKCHGSWVPPLQAEALIEYSHRLSAAVVGLLVFIVAFIAWLRYRSNRAIFWPAVAALGAVLIQGGLGGVVVARELSGELVALHFALSLTILGVLTVLTVNVYLPGRGSLDSPSKAGIVSALSVAIVLMLGALVTQWGAALAFGDWPLFDGGVLPASWEAAKIIHFLHRIGAALLGVVLGLSAMTVARRELRDRLLTGIAFTAFGLWMAQVVVGGASVLTRTAPWTVVFHVVLAELLWISVVTLSVAAYRRSRAAPNEALREGRPERGAAETVKAYFLLTKPRIIELLLITTVPSMVLAADGWPSLGLMAATVLGGATMAGAANAINCYFDRDIDARMRRTEARPLPRGSIEPTAALRFGVGLAVASLAWLIGLVNLLAALLALSALLFYVFVYTVWLKRTSPSNIVIGGAAGAVPVLVGWAAVTGGIGPEALVLFGLIFYWTPPHFWALSLRYSSEYRDAGVPMLPVVRGVIETVNQMLCYTVAMAGLSFGLVSIAGVGVVYSAAALLLAVVFGASVVHLRGDPGPRRAMIVFRTSILYLALLFIGIAADRLMNAPQVPDLDAIAMPTGILLFAAGNLALAGLAARRRIAGRRPVPPKLAESP
jgi:protoheme IX farnesyltransferase